LGTETVTFCDCQRKKKGSGRKGGEGEHTKNKFGIPKGEKKEDDRSGNK